MNKNPIFQLRTELSVCEVELTDDEKYPIKFNGYTRITPYFEHLDSLCGKALRYLHEQVLARSYEWEKDLMVKDIQKMMVLFKVEDGFLPYRRGVYVMDHGKIIRPDDLKPYQLNMLQLFWRKQFEMMDRICNNLEPLFKVPRSLFKWQESTNDLLETIDELWLHLKIGEQEGTEVEFYTAMCHLVGMEVPRNLNQAIYKVRNREKPHNFLWKILKKYTYEPGSFRFLRRN